MLTVADRMLNYNAGAVVNMIMGIWEGAVSCGGYIFGIIVQWIGAIIEAYIEAGMDIYAALASCPVNIVIVDEQGNRAGYVDGTIYKEIEGCEVAVADDQKLVLIPRKGSYTVILEGTAVGTMDFQMILPTGENIATTVQYRDVSIGPATKMTVGVNPENPAYLMLIDDNGDGQPDEERQPDTVDGSPDKTEVSPGFVGGIIAAVVAMGLLVFVVLRRRSAQKGSKA